MISDPVTFLANIALVARADGMLSASELGQLEAIRKEFGFKKGDLSAAVRLAESGNIHSRPWGLLRTKLRTWSLFFASPTQTATSIAQKSNL